MKQALTSLRDDLRATNLPYELLGADQAAGDARRLADQLDDYVLPRLESMDAPLLVVIGGSTGAGKSTLVSSLVGAPVTAASPIRPTTRRPVLLHAPRDASWFDGDRVLGTLARLRMPPGAPPSPAGEHTPRELELRACSTLPDGLALLDAPDIDSVVSENRDLAGALLASADVWVFVTTAARYADAVPWQHLRAAATRQVTIGIILNRVPAQDYELVEADLRRRLSDASLGHAPVFTILETSLDAQSLLSPQAVAPVRSWLEGLVDSAARRRTVAAQTLTGAIRAVLGEAAALADHLADQEAEHASLSRTVEEAHQEALANVCRATADGSMLRGEVLARWQELVGTGEMLRGLETGIGRLRDRLGAALRGRPAPAERVEKAIESTLAELIATQAQGASLQVARAWRRRSTAQQLAEATAAAAPYEDLERRAAELVRTWQGQVLDMVRQEGAGRRLTARLLSLGVNASGVLLMVLVFAHTGGLSGGEVGIAGGTALISQRLLEAVFGDQAMRTMTRRARTELTEFVRTYLEDQQAAFTGSLADPAPTSAALHAHLTDCGQLISTLAAQSQAPTERP